jgi:hypothetical protein
VDAAEYCEINGGNETSGPDGPLVLVGGRSYLKSLVTPLIVVSPCFPARGTFVVSIDSLRIWSLEAGAGQPAATGGAEQPAALIQTTKGYATTH